MLIEIVADVVCPWCYIGKRRLERALALRPGIKTRLQWRAFQLNRDVAAINGSLGRLHAAAIQAGASEGINFRFDLIERMADSFDAHRLGKFAARHGKQNALMDILYRRYFEQGDDIGQAAILIAAAVEAGLDGAATASFLASGDERDTVLSEDRNARRLGLNGVPCFIIGGRYALSGAQEPEFFLPLLDLAREDLRESLAV
jgi:predicted DsbA family dithiol-disulfide isomerase